MPRASRATVLGQIRLDYIDVVESEFPVQGVSFLGGLQPSGGQTVLFGFVQSSLNQSRSDPQPLVLG
jgi:hypothetical protein